MTEKELIQGCKKEKHSFQKKLYDLYSGKMYAVCLRYGRSNSEAQDMLQDGFIKVFDNIQKFKFEGSFEGWIRRIIINTALNYCRKSSFKQEFLGEDQLKEMVVASKALSNMSEKEIMNVIQSLPDGYRIVFNLYVIEGYNHEEIGQMLNISKNTSRSQLSKGRKYIQNLLKKLNNTGYVE